MVRHRMVQKAVRQGIVDHITPRQKIGNNAAPPYSTIPVGSFALPLYDRSPHLKPFHINLQLLTL